MPDYIYPQSQENPINIDQIIHTAKHFSLVQTSATQLHHSPQLNTFIKAIQQYNQNSTSMISSAHQKKATAISFFYHTPSSTSMNRRYSQFWNERPPEMNIGSEQQSRLNMSPMKEILSQQSPRQTSIQNKSTNQQKLSPASSLRKHNSFYVSGCTLRKYGSLPLKNSLLLLQRCIGACRGLIKECGEPHINISQIRVTKQGQIKLESSKKWILIHRTHSTFNQLKVLNQLMRQTREISDKSFLDFYRYYLRSSQKLKINLKGMTTLIRTYAKCAKVELSPFITPHHKQQYQIEQKSPKRTQKIRVPRLSMRDQIDLGVSPRQSGSFFSKCRSTDTLLTSKMKNNNNICHQYAVTITNTNNQLSVPKNPIKMSSTSTHTKDSSDVHTSRFGSNKNGSESEWGLVSFNINYSPNQFATLNSNCSETTTKLSLNNQLNIQSILSNSEINEVISEGYSSTQRSNPEEMCRHLSDNDQERDIAQRQQMRINEESILSKNNWTRKMETLITNQSSFKQSYSINCQTINPNTKKKEGWGTQTVESQIMEQ